MGPAPAWLGAAVFVAQSTRGVATAVASLPLLVVLPLTAAGGSAAPLLLVLALLPMQESDPAPDRAPLAAVA